MQYTVVFSHMSLSCLLMFYFCLGFLEHQPALKSYNYRYIKEQSVLALLTHSLILFFALLGFVSCAFSLYSLVQCVHETGGKRGAQKPQRLFSPCVYAFFSSFIVLVYPSASSNSLLPLHKTHTHTLTCTALALVHH